MSRAAFTANTIYESTTKRGAATTAAAGCPMTWKCWRRNTQFSGVANVRSWDECRAAIRNGYPVLVCSDQGFAMERDDDGFCNPRGTWYHAMAVIGVRGGERPGGFLLNSWGPDVA